MDKLEIKLTLSADSTPELLRYLRGISSARDRAFILKRLATAGLAGLSGTMGGDAALLPSPTSAIKLTADPSAAVLLNSQPAPASGLAPVPMVATTSSPAQVVAPAPPLAPEQASASAAPASLPLPDVADREMESTAGFEFLDLEALNAATAQFA